MNDYCAVKEPSPAQLEEINEGRRIKSILSSAAVFSVSCGIIGTLVGLKLIKLMMGVDSFGFQLWTWLGIHFVIFWVGVLISIMLITIAVFAIILIARLCRAT
jgi:molybdopterin/thiamine biosynthesis adenylyltransferase